MHISSLPGKFGIGTFGKEAYKFVDFLSRTGLTYWQILPLGPTGYGDSPYQSFSAPCVEVHNTLRPCNRNQYSPLPLRLLLNKLQNRLPQS